MTKHDTVLVTATLAALLALFAPVPIAGADIFQWEYINPADPTQGKQPSTTLVPDGAGEYVEPGVNLENRNLTMAYLIGANLSPRVVYDDYEYISFYERAVLTSAILNQADLSHANLGAAALSGASLIGADVRGANFDRYDQYGYSVGYGYGTGITVAQLSSTASYVAHDLSGISLGANNLADANFAGCNLTDARFAGANMTNANFSNANLTRATISGTLTGTNLSNAEVRGASLDGVTKTQLYSTASYQANDLTGITLYSAQTGWNFAGKNLSQATFQSSMNLKDSNFSNANLTNAYLSRVTLTNANLSQANLTGANFSWGKLTGVTLTGAEVRDADFTCDSYFNPGTGLTLDQLYLTASYQAHDLTGIRLQGNSLIAANLAGQNLTNANLVGASLEGANLTGAEVRGAIFHRDVSRSQGGITWVQLQATASYQAHDLSGIGLGGNYLAGANLMGQNLTSASFVTDSDNGANLSGADLRQANLSNARLGRSTLANATLIQANLANLDLHLATFTNANLSQANLSNADLSGYYVVYGGGEGGGYVHFPGANLMGANLAGANLTRADFSGTDDYVSGYPHPGANFTNANLSGADARDANFKYATLTGAITTNLIQANAHIAGLNLTAGASLVVRDYDGGVTIIVDQHLAMDAAGTLQLVFDADPWDSTISFAPGIPVARGGTLELTFAPGVDVAAQSGRTIDLFNWTGVNPTGAFTVSSLYSWDLTKLYTTGEVTLLPTADFNGDKQVDGADLAAWSANFGLPAGAANNQGDADADLDVDGADFLAWQQQFDGEPGGNANSHAVPEPGGLLLALAAIGAYRLGSRRRERLTHESD